MASPNASTTVTGSPEKTGAVIVVLVGAVEVVGPVLPRGVSILRPAVSPAVEVAHTFVNVIVACCRVLATVQMTPVATMAAVTVKVPSASGWAPLSQVRVVS